ncbi:MAG: hypothetical protein Q7V09_13900 [Hydrogenophaga sp.]|nr:hypothetical protein [Hydrogenophaga sp.]
MSAWGGSPATGARDHTVPSTCCGRNACSRGSAASQPSRLPCASSGTRPSYTRPPAHSTRWRAFQSTRSPSVWPGSMACTRKLSRPTRSRSPTASVRLGSTMCVPAIAFAPARVVRLARQSGQRCCMALRVAALARISS